MANVALAVEFWESYRKFQTPIQKSIDKLIETTLALDFDQLNKKAGTHLESHVGARDKRARTLRVDSNHRLIAMDMGDGESLLFVKVDTHDKTDQWMARNEFRINQATSAIEILDVESVKAAATNAAPPAPEGILAHRRDKDLTQLGIEPDLIGVIRGITDEVGLLAIAALLPRGQADALLMLTDEDRTVESIYEAVAGSIEPEEIDTEDFVAALEKPANRASYHLVTSDGELAKMLAAPAAAWRTYLHHTQRSLAYRPLYNGPVRVTGGAGTGKTVVAIHRAKALAQPYLDRGEVPPSKPILFTTFTRNLAQAIEKDLRLLGGADLVDLVDVVNVDQLARRIVNDADQNAPAPRTADSVRELWQQIIDEEGFEYSEAFLNAEFEQVVLAQSITSRADYFQAQRRGRGVPLDRRARADVWRAIERFTQHLVQSNSRTFLQLAETAAGYLNQRTERPYEHVIVDEAQDLHETQWHLLRAAVAEGPNDMFIVGDSHQRIYSRRSSLKREGIDIVGRSSKLRINYRTSAQILSWAMALLGEETYDDLSDGTDEQTLGGYHSLLSGEPPVTCAAKSAKEQTNELVQQIHTWLADPSVEAEDIGVTARSEWSLTAVSTALDAAGISYTKLGRDLKSGSGIQLGTMHRLKGLEFLCVAVFDCDDDRMPNQHALTDKTDDELQHRLDLQLERCLLYVACTRARNHLWVGWSGKPSRFLGPIIGDL